MKRRQLLLVQMQPLLSEGLRLLFLEQEDVDLVCLTYTDLEKMDDWPRHLHADIILLAGEKEDERAERLIMDMLQQYEDVPVVWIVLETTVFRVYTSRTLTATSASLIQAIRESNARRVKMVPLKETSKRETRR